MKPFILSHFIFCFMAQVMWRPDVLRILAFIWIRRQSYQLWIHVWDAPAPSLCKEVEWGSYRRARRDLAVRQEWQEWKDGGRWRVEQWRSLDWVSEVYEEKLGCVKRKQMCGHSLSAPGMVLKCIFNVTTKWYKSSYAVNIMALFNKQFWFTAHVINNSETDGSDGRSGS